MTMLRLIAVAVSVGLVISMAMPAQAGFLGNPGYPYSYSWSVAAMHPGPADTPGTNAYNELNGVSSILSDGHITTQGDIDAALAAGAPDTWLLNGETKNGATFFGPYAGSITFDLGAPKQLGVVDIHSVFVQRFAVIGPKTITVSIDQGAPIAFTGFVGDELPAAIAPDPTGQYEHKAVTHQVDLTGLSGQSVKLDFELTWEWMTVNEAVFHVVPEPASMQLLVLGGLMLVRRHHRRTK